MSFDEVFEKTFNDEIKPDQTRYRIIIMIFEF